MMLVERNVQFCIIVLGIINYVDKLHTERKINLNSHILYLHEASPSPFILAKAAQYITIKMERQYGLWRAKDVV